MDGPLVGRHDLMSRIVALLKLARTERAVTVFVRGDAGVGKTRLLGACLDEARLLGYRVFAGRCEVLEEGVPYGALRQAFGAGRTDDKQLAVVRTSLLSAQGGSVIGGGSELSRVSASTERLLRDASRRQPVLLALDDLHISDRDTLAAFSMLARNLGDARVVVLGLLRDRWPDTSPVLELLIERLLTDGLATVVDLPPLDANDTRALLNTLLSGPPHDDLVAAVWDAARGSPLFSIEALQSLQERGAVRATDRQWELVDDTTRASIRSTSALSALLDRIDRAGSDARAVARVLTVLGRVRLDRIGVVAELAAISEADAARAFDDLLRANVVHSVGDAGYEFAHPIVQATLYEDLGPAERRHLHGAAAHVLHRARASGQPVNQVELATHLAESVEPPDPATSALLAEVGDTAMRSSPLSAAAWYERAAALLDNDDPERPALRARRARALYIAGRFEEAVAAAGETLTHPLGPAEWARTAAIAVHGLASVGRFEEALALADDLLERAAGSGAGLRAQKASLLQQLDRLESAEHESRLALDMVDGDPGTASLLLGQLAGLAFARGRMSETLDLLAQQEQLDYAVGPLARIAALFSRSTYLALMGLVEEARRNLDECRAEARGFGTEAFRPSLALLGLLIDWLTGDWDSALRRWPNVLRSDVEASSVMLARCAVVDILVARGDYGEARALCAEMEDSAAVGTSAVASFAAWARSGLELSLGRLAAARDLLADGWASDQRSGRLSTAQFVLSRLVEVDMALGELESARQWSQLLDEAASDGVAPAIGAAAGRTRAAVTGDAEGAAEALALAARHGLVPEVARCQLLLGELGIDPATNLRSACDTFEELGMVSGRRRAVAELRRRRLPRPRQARTLTDALTDDDLRLARLVGEGFTNREIAAALHYSPKTVEVYLSRLYAKTGCSTRVELAVAVRNGRLERAANE